METELFVSGEGVELKLRYVSARNVVDVLMQYEAPDPPTYTVKAAGGVELEFEHDETTLETAEDYRAWREYTAAKAKVEYARQAALSAFLVDVCIVNEPPPLEEWRVPYSDWGLEAPDPQDRKEFKRRWIEEEICPNPKDFTDLLLKLYQMSGLQEGAIRQIEKFFRLALAGPGVGGVES